jgi:site-specific DNA-methyltransferase (adenine-specific)
VKVPALYNLDGVEGLGRLESGTIPMTLTSPPYDRLRSYGGHRFDIKTFQAIASELWRVSMEGGVVAWVVRDQILDGSISGTSFRQVCFFQNLGFRLHNLLVIESHVMRGVARNRYGVAPEFVHVLSKGRPRTANILQRKNKYAGVSMRFCDRDKEGRVSETKVFKVRPTSNRGHVWRYTSGRGHTSKDAEAFVHPGAMHESLARDLIISWSKPGDVVLDPLSGSGTSAKMALLNDRRYLGFEVHEPYHQLAMRRLSAAHVQNNRRIDERLRG